MRLWHSQLAGVCTGRTVGAPLTPCMVQGGTQFGELHPGVSPLIRPGEKDLIHVEQSARTHVQYLATFKNKLGKYQASLRTKLMLNMCDCVSLAAFLPDS